MRAPEHPSVIDDALRRIQDKRGRCLAMNRGTQSHGRDDPFYTWHPPPIGVADLERIEAYFDLRLPQEYRRYVSEVANGGMGPSFYPMLGALEAIVYGGRQKRPFPLDAPRLNGVSSAENKSCRAHLILKGLIAEDTPIEPVFMPQDVSVSDGTILVADSGCGLDELLVMAGPRRGEVWHDSDSGSVLRTTGYLSFVESWLDAELARDRLVRQARLEFDATERVQRVHHLLSDVASLFDRIHVRRLSGSLESEWLRERDAVLTSGVLRWNLRFAMGEAAEACSDLDDATSVHAALAALYFELRQDDKALEEVRRAEGGAAYDGLLHARILLSLGQGEQAQPLLRALVESPAEPSESELWYEGEVDEVQRAFDDAPVICVAQRAAALRYLGEHAEALALCEAQSDEMHWPRFERAANLERMGRRAEASACVQRALDASFADPALLTRDPAWAEFAKSPEFEALGKAYHAESRQP